MSTVMVERLDLATAQAQYDEADREWRTAVDLDRALEHPNTLADERIDRLGLRGLFSRDPAGRAQVDQVALDVQRARSARRREDAALALGDARETLTLALVEAASEKLPDALAEHEAAAADLAHELAALEGAYATMIARCWRARSALNGERKAAAKLVTLGKDAAPSDAVREAIRTRAELHSLPVELDVEGPTAWADRPPCGMFGLSDAANDPRNPKFWENLGAIASEDKPRPAKLGRRLREQVLQAQQHIENETTR